MTRKKKTVSLTMGYPTSLTFTARGVKFMFTGGGTQKKTRSDIKNIDENSANFGAHALQLTHEQIMRGMSTDEENDYRIRFLT